MAKSSFFKDGGAGTNTAASIQNQVDAAAASATSAATSLAAIGTELTDATAAKVAAEAAQAAAETAQTSSEGARDTAITNRNAADTSAASASNSATNSQTSETNAASSQSAAATSASNAATSETNAAASETAAATSATNAATSETNAASSATAAAGSASTASTQATDAATSATTATTKASEASTSATNAATSETNAGNSATAAAGSASTASTQATNAATSATNAATSATNAAASETNIGNAETNAASSATAAQTAQTAAETAKTSAETAQTSASNSASAASTSETNAGSSATAAATSATNAATSATTATTKASEASTSATNAATSETNAGNSATAAASSATAAAASQTAAAASAASAATTYDQFDDRYHGSLSSNPSTDPDGNALAAGMLYFNSTAGEMRVFDGSSWIAASAATNASLILYEYTATAGQTTFSGSDDNSASLSYTVDNLQVVMNGVVLDPADFTATNGTSVVLASGATAGDQINIYAFKSFTTADMVSKTAGGTFSGAVGFSGGITGDVSFDTNTLHVDSTNNRVGVGTTSPDTIAEIVGANPIVTIRDTETSSGSAEATLRLAESGAGDSLGSYWDIKASGGSLHFIDNWDEGGGTGTRVTLTDSGNVGIGTTSPNTKLDIVGSSTNGSGIVDTLRLRNTGTTQNDGARIQFTAGSSTSGAGIGSGGQALNSADLRFYAGGNTERMRIDSSGNVGIGTSSPSAGLHIDNPSNSAITAILDTDNSAVKMVFRNNTETGNNVQIGADGSNLVALTNGTERMRIDSSGHITSLPTYNNGSASSANVVVNSSGLFLRSVSARKYKADIEDVEASYAEALYGLRPVYYRSTLDADNSDHSHWGFIAEEVAAIDPRLVHYATHEVTYDDDGAAVETELDTPVAEGVQYERFVPLLLKLITDQKDRIEDLETQNANFETRLTALEAG